MPTRYYSPCSLGLESVLAAELTALDARDVVPGRGGVAFSGDRELGYRCCLWLRSAVRVQEILAEFPAPSPEALYDGVAALDWPGLSRVDDTLAVDANVRDSAITHSGFAALKTKDAIVDCFRAATGRRPSVDRKRPDLPLKLVIKRDHAQLSRDLSGASLHKRGYRPIQVKSPLNESIAAGLLLLAGWDRRTALADPMCGSGTLVIEAALMACDRAPGLGRGFAFERWPDLDHQLWTSLREEARERVRPDVPCSLVGADRHGGAISLAQRAAHQAGVEGLVSFSVSSAADWRPQPPPGFVITNPPWGERLESDDLDATWDELSLFLKQGCPGATAHVLSGNPELTRRLRMKADRRWPVRNGPIDCRLLRYEIFDGRREAPTPRA